MEIQEMSSTAVWRTGSTHQLIRDCENIEVMRKIYSEGLYQAMNLYADTSTDQVRAIIHSLFSECQFDGFYVLDYAIKKLLSGSLKIYGRVTPSDINGLITEARNKQAEVKERQHQALKQANKQNESEPFDREAFYRKGREYYDKKYLKPKESKESATNVSDEQRQERIKKGLTVFTVEELELFIKNTNNEQEKRLAEIEINNRTLKR